MFDTLVTRRIWKALEPHFKAVQAFVVKDDKAGKVWHIRALTPVRR